MVAFRLAEANNWIAGARGFSLHIMAGVARRLGHCCDGAPAFLATFVRSAPPIVWHGYAISSVGNRISGRIVNDWRGRGYITKPVTRKVLRGQICNL